MKILVIKPSSLGDVVHGLRVIYQIHCFFPDSCIDWVIKEELGEFLSTCGFIKKVFHYRRNGGFVSYLKLTKNIRRTEYDYVLDFQGLLRSGILTFFAKGKAKLGVADGREFSTFFYTNVGERCRKKEIHAIERLIPFFRHLGVDEFNPLLPLNFEESSYSPQNDNLLCDKPYLIFFPESRRPEKIWPLYKDLFYELKKVCDYRIVIAGNNPGNDFPESIDLRGKLSLYELPQLIAKAKLVITNDSAPLHIASAMNIPTVALFGPTSVSKYGPYPNSQINFISIKGENNQINTISTKSVLGAVEMLL